MGEIDPAAAVFLVRPEDYEVDADDCIDRLDDLPDGVPQRPGLHALR